jgi:hypothetical protein
MAWNLRAANGDGSATFFFEANNAEPGQVARAIGEHYAVSVLVHGTVAEKKVSGRLIAADLHQALDGLSFLLGVPWRANTNRSVFLMGGSPEKIVQHFPSYGLTQAQLGGLIKDGAVSLVADRVVMEVDQAKGAQVAQVLETFADRKQITLELLLVDVATTTVDRVNEWLDTVRVGGGYYRNTLVKDAAAGAVGGVPGVAARRSGFFQDTEIKALFELLDKDRTSKVEMREQLHLLSGSSSEFTSGEVIENRLFVRQAQTSNDLLQEIERRTVGLRIRIGGTAYRDAWHLTLDLQDSSIVGGRERTTGLQAEKLMDPRDGFISLATFQRRAVDASTQTVPTLAKGFLKKLFTKSTSTKADRSVMILVRPILSVSR